MEYNMNTNYLEIIAGTSNRYNPVYEAAEKDVEKNTDKGMRYLQNFLTSIDNLTSKKGVSDPSISKSQGNIKSFKGYDNIKFAVDFLSKNLGSIPEVKDCADCLKYVEKYQPQYSEAYNVKNRLGILEYESAVYMLNTTLSMIIANDIDVVANGNQIRIQKKKGETFGVIPKTMTGLVKQLRDPGHGSYLAELNKSASEIPDVKVNNEGVLYSEGVIGDVAQAGTLGYQIGKNIVGAVKNGFNAFKRLRKSVFGIVPIVRSIAYLRYKKKADTIISLDQQCEFIKNNIEQLKNRTNMDSKQKAEIIKKQQATIEAYQKKAAKLRAELMEGEKDAATAQAKEDKQIGTTDDDMVLESGKTIVDIFDEYDEDPVSNKDESFGQDVHIHDPFTDSKCRSIFKKNPMDNPSGISVGPFDFDANQKKVASIPAVKLSGDDNDKVAIKKFNLKHGLPLAAGESSDDEMSSVLSSEIDLAESNNEIDEGFGPHFHEVERRLQGDSRSFEDRLNNSPLGRAAAARHDDDPDDWNDPEPYDPKYDKSVAMKGDPDDPDNWNDPEPYDPKKESAADQEAFSKKVSKANTMSMSDAEKLDSNSNNKKKPIKPMRDVIKITD